MNQYFIITIIIIITILGIWLVIYDVLRDLSKGPYINTLYCVKLYKICFDSAF